MSRLLVGAILLAAGLNAVAAQAPNCAPCTQGPGYACPAACYGGPITFDPQPTATSSSSYDPCAPCTESICPAGSCAGYTSNYGGPGGSYSTYVPPPPPSPPPTLTPTPIGPCEACTQTPGVACPAACPQSVKDIALRNKVIAGNSCNNCTSRICPQFCTAYTSLRYASDPLPPHTLEKRAATTPSSSITVVNPPPSSLTGGPTPIPGPVCNCCQCDIECGACPDCACESGLYPSYVPPTSYSSASSASSYTFGPSSGPSSASSSSFICCGSSAIQPSASSFSLSPIPVTSVPLPTSSGGPEPICNCCQCDAGCQACPDCIAPPSFCSSSSFSQPIISEPSTLPWYTTTGLPRPTPVTPKPKPKTSTTVCKNCATPLAPMAVKPRTLEKVVRE